MGLNFLNLENNSLLNICRYFFYEDAFGLTRSSLPEVFSKKDVLKICSKSTGEHPCGSVISINMLCNFIEITLKHGCSPVNLLQQLY